MSLLSPINFEYVLRHNSHEIKYDHFREISQGGPVVGNLFIDGKPIGKDHLFGGPALFSDRFMFCPKLQIRFFRRGFRISMIDLDSLRVTVWGPVLDLILLSRLDKEKIEFFSDLENTEKMNASLP
jgi:hypothetical protein